jgi:hypothetical protein
MESSADLQPFVMVNFPPLEQNKTEVLHNRTVHKPSSRIVNTSYITLISLIPKKLAKLQPNN